MDWLSIEEQKGLELKKERKWAINLFAKFFLFVLTEARTVWKPPITPTSPPSSCQLVSVAMQLLSLQTGSSLVQQQGFSQDQPVSGPFQVDWEIAACPQSPAHHPASNLHPLVLPPRLKAPAAEWRALTSSPCLPVPAEGWGGCSGRSSPSAELCTSVPAAPASPAKPWSGHHGASSTKQHSASNRALGLRASANLDFHSWKYY